MKHNVITVTRQFGSLGRPIAKLIAKKMNIAYYDRDIIDATAEMLGIPVGQYQELKEKKLTTYDKMMYPLGIGDMVMQDKIFEAEKKVILDLAAKEDCLIVGRCADYILYNSDICNTFNVFIYAPYENRKMNCHVEFGIVPEFADDYIIKVDSSRSKVYERYTGSEFMSLAYRNMLIDSSKMSKEDIADLIIDAASKSFKS